MQKEIIAALIEALEEERIGYLMASSMAAMVYGIPRSTKDVDFVIELEQPSFDNLIRRTEPLLILDPQQHLESLTWTRRFILTSRTSPFKVELFIKGNDPHHNVQWERKQQVYSLHAERHVWMPTPEDVIIQKLRWGRPQDRIDAEQVMAVQADALDWPYIEHWTEIHQTRKLMEEIKASIPPI